MKPLEIALLFIVVISLPQLNMSGDKPEDNDMKTNNKDIFSHRLPCTDKEEKSAACLNGGKCTAIKLFTARLKFCRCGASYKGSRCEEYDFQISNSGLTIGLPVGVGLFVLAVVIVVLIVVCCRKRRMVQRHAQLNSKNGKDHALEELKENGSHVHSPPANAENKPAPPNGPVVGVPLIENERRNNDDEGDDDVFIESDESRTEAAPLARPESYYDL